MIVCLFICLIVSQKQSTQNTKILSPHHVRNRSGSGLPRSPRRSPPSSPSIPRQNSTPTSPQSRSPRHSPLVQPKQWPSHLLCPITGLPMDNPVIAADGITYEKSAIDDWIQNNTTSPLLGSALAHTDLIPNPAVKQMLVAFRTELP